MRTVNTYPTFSISRSPGFIATKNLLAFDDSSVLIITEADVDGYDDDRLVVPVGARYKMWSGFRLPWPFRIAGAEVSCLWLHFKLNSKMPGYN
ncbi:unnamed protein product [Cuscuta campestris]|nr:unnamed protein product [Cuscuta campestris]